MNDTERNIIIQSLIHMNADQIFRYYREGIITMNDIQEQGVEYSIQQQIKELINESQQEEENAWNDCLNTISLAFSKYDPTEKMESLMQAIVKLDEYAATYPNSNRIPEVNSNKLTINEKFEDLKWDAISKQIENLSNVKGSIQKLEELTRIKKEIDAFVNQYPNNSNYNAAQNQKNMLLAEIFSIENEKNRGKEIIDQLTKNINSYDPIFIKEKLSTGVISEDDLKSILPQKIIDSIYKYNEKQLDIGKQPDLEFLPSDINEVYFWGIVSSGKTTAVGSILSNGVKHNPKFSIDTGNGRNYGDQLSNMFNTQNNSILPNRNNFTATQLISVTYFDKIQSSGLFNFFTKNSEGRASFLDLSGELFKCFHFHIANKDMPTPLHVAVFENFQKLISSNNVKHHFFFVDYNLNNFEPDEFGLTQSNYLNAAISYFQENNTFQRSTKSIYIVITKMDSCNEQNKEKWDEIANSLVDEQYRDLKAGLEIICKKYNINDDGKLKIIPFSIGKVYLQMLCETDFYSAERLNNIIKDQLFPKKSGCLSFLSN